MKRQRLPYRRDLKPLERRLRGNQTNVEQLLWSSLRRKQVLEVQFYRQRPIGNFIVDFYAPKAKLVIEVAGGQHWDEVQTNQDHNRDKTLETKGLKVLRFSNVEVLQETEAVLDKIYVQVKAELEKSPLTPLL